MSYENLRMEVSCVSFLGKTIAGEVEKYMKNSTFTRNVRPGSSCACSKSESVTVLDFRRHFKSLYKSRASLSLTGWRALPADEQDPRFHGGPYRPFFARAQVVGASKKYISEHFG